MSLSQLLRQAIAESGRELLIDDSDETVSELAKTIIEWGAKNRQGGIEHYWPARYAELPKGERDAAIRKEFNGQNLKMICEKYGVHPSTVYRAARGQ